MTGSQGEARKGSTAESNHSLWNFERFPSDNTQNSNTYRIPFLFSDKFLYCSLFKTLKYSTNSKYIILRDQWTSLRSGFVTLQVSHSKAILERARISSENEELLM